MGVRPIFALSPQAKGRVERLFGTLQDRLVAEMRFNGINNMDEGNGFLDKTFIKRFNRRFSVRRKGTEKAWRKPPEGIDMTRIISFRYEAIVSNDNTASLGGIVLNIPPGPNERSYAKTRVEARQLLDGSWRVYYGDKLVARHRSTAPNEPIRTLNRRAKRIKSYSWIYLESKSDDQIKGHFRFALKGTY